TSSTATSASTRSARPWPTSAPTPPRARWWRGSTPTWTARSGPPPTSRSRPSSPTSARPPDARAASPRDPRASSGGERRPEQPDGHRHRAVLPPGDPAARPELLGEQLAQLGLAVQHGQERRLEGAHVPVARRDVPEVERGGAARVAQSRQDHAHG